MTCCKAASAAGPIAIWLLLLIASGSCYNSAKAAATAAAGASTQHPSKAPEPSTPAPAADTWSPVFPGSQFPGIFGLSAPAAAFWYQNQGPVVPKAARSPSAKPVQAPEIQNDAMFCTHRPLRDPRNGAYPESCKNLAVGARCKGKCWAGYAGAPSTVCQRSTGGIAGWGPDQGTCVRVVCKTQPVNPSGGTFPATCKGMFGGQACRGTCAQYYSGAINTTCTRMSAESAVGNWSRVRGQCRKITACSVLPDDPRNGAYPNSCIRTAVNSNCTAVCKEGANGLPYAPTVTCLPTGEWSTSSGLCIADQCVRPTTPSGGAAKPNCTVSPTDGSETCVFTCKVAPPASSSMKCDTVVDETVWTNTTAACSPEQCSRTTRPAEGAGASGTWSCSVSGQLEVCTVKCISPPTATTTVVCNLTAAGARVWTNSTSFCVPPTCTTTTRPAPPTTGGTWSCSTSGTVQTCTAACPPNTGTTATVVCNATASTTKWDYTQRCLACSTVNRPSPPTGTWSCSTTGTVDTCTAPCVGSTSRTTAVCNAAVDSTLWTTSAQCPVAPKCSNLPAVPSGAAPGTNWTCATADTVETCTVACNASSLTPLAAVRCDATTNRTSWTSTASCTFGTPTCNAATRPPIPAASTPFLAWSCSTSGAVETCTVPCDVRLSSVPDATVECDAVVNNTLWVNTTAMCPNSTVCTRLPPVPINSVLSNWSCSANGTLTTCHALCRWQSTANTTLVCNATEDPFRWTNRTAYCTASNQSYVGTSEVGLNETLLPYQIVCPPGTFATDFRINATNNGSIGLNMSCSDGSTPVPWIGYNQTLVSPVTPIENFNWTTTAVTSPGIGFNKVQVRQASNTSFIQAIGIVANGVSGSPAMFGNVTGNETTLSCAPQQRIVGLWGSQNLTMIGSVALNCSSPCLLSQLPVPPTGAPGWNCTASAGFDSCRAQCPGGVNTVLNATTIYCNPGMGAWFNSQPLECINITTIP